MGFLDYIDSIFNYDKYYDETNDMVLYTDTDSVFIKSKNRNVNEIEKIMDEISDRFSLILNSKYRNNKDFKYKLKTECLIDTIVLFGKKMYFLIKDDNSVEIVGLEGKKETFGIAKNILNDILEFLLSAKNNKMNIKTKDGIIFINNLYYKYYSLIKNINNIWDIDPQHVIDMIGFPINITKNTGDLKAVSSYYRGVVVFDYFYNKKFGYKFWENNINTKGYHIYIKERNTNFNGEEIYKNLGNIKNKEIKDLTIPDIMTNNKNVMEYFKDLFIINDDEYKNLINQKISRLGKFLSPFSDKNINNNKKYICLFNNNINLSKNINELFDKSKDIRYEESIINYSS